MIHTQKIEKNAIDSFAFLMEQSWFKKNGVKKTATGTYLTYFGDDLSVEIELDWRESGVFVLIVLMENGKLPKGYYSSKDGKVIRKHFYEVIKEEFDINIRVSSDAAQYTDKLFEDEITFYAGMLKQYADLLMKKGRSIFDE